MSLLLWGSPQVVLRDFTKLDVCVGVKRGLHVGGGIQFVDSSSVPITMPVSIAG